jgi:hypothetical protein
VASARRLPGTDGAGEVRTRFQRNIRPGNQDRPALTFLVVSDGSPIASFTSSVAAATLAECVKREDPSRAVVILVEETIPKGRSGSPPDEG